MLLPLLASVWFVGGGLLVLRAAGSSLAFLGESPSPEELARSARALVAAAWVGAGVPVLGLAVAVLARRRAATILFTVLLVFGLAFAALTAADRHRARLREPQPRAPVTVCQEFSGGDTRCPGG